MRFGVLIAFAAIVQDVLGAAPAPGGCHAVTTELLCVNCMFMGGKCMSMSGQPGCGSKSEEDCVDCAWSNTSQSCWPGDTPPPAPTCADAQGEADCLECMLMDGKCMGMSGQQGCSAKTAEGCLDCAWSPAGQSCLLVTPPPAPNVCADAKTEAACWDCMVMQGKCMSMSGQQGCSSEPTGNCLSCHWSGTVCMQNTGGGGAAGQMMMTFYSSHKVVILFDQWNVKTRGQYAAAVVLVFLAGLSAPLLKDYAVSSRMLPLPARACLIFVNFCLVYCLMLVAMTYNVGLFFATMAGLTTGWIAGERLKVRNYRARGDVDDEDHAFAIATLTSDINCH